MRLNDLMRVSLRQVMRHRRRYMGVVLAIALGVAGFLNIVTMSREVKNNFNENLDLIGGVTVLRIYFDNQRSYRPQWFRQQTLTALKRLDGVKELSLTSFKYSQTNFRASTSASPPSRWMKVSGRSAIFGLSPGNCSVGRRGRAQTGSRAGSQAGQEDFRHYPDPGPGPGDQPGDLSDFRGVGGSYR